VTVGNDALGYVASTLVLCTFLMRSMRWLRVAAVASNVAFILYGHAAGIVPVFALHLILLPINAMRLVEALEAGSPGRLKALARTIARPCEWRGRRAAPSC
jgi:hypothetical protein